MFNLIKLELKKFKIRKNIFASIISNICILGLVCLIFFIERAEGNTTFESYEMLFEILGTIVNVTFIIFAGVLISKFIVEEYKNKTIYLLFTYPISRKKMMLSKMVIVSVFTFMAIIISSIAVFCTFYFIQVITNTTIGNLTTVMISQQIISVIFAAFANSTIALVPMYFGLRKKSAPATMVAATLTAMFLYSSNGGFSLYNIIVIPIAFALVGMFIAYFTIKDIEKKDVVV